MRLLAPATLLSAALLLGNAAAAATSARPTRQASDAPGAANPAPGPSTASLPPLEGIVAVVNGDVISQGDVTARTRLFALSTGLPMTPDVLARLRPQVTRQLVDERLRLQEEQKRKIVVSDKEIADAVASIEQRNGMQPGTMRAKLGAEGVALRTLYDQTRVQLGWSRVLRDELGPRAEITDADVANQQQAMKAQVGQTEYRVGEIFLPIEDPTKAADTAHFADTVIGQLRAGAPFSVVAAQFSQSQTALQGGDLGWIHLNQLDPQVAAIVSQMPEGAISNPITVPGGISIVTMHGKREVGKDMATMLSLRQVFLPFSTPLDPKNPTEQQKKQLLAAESISKTVHSCEGIEAANKAAGSTRPADPGEVRMEGLNPTMKSLLAGLQPGQVSRPLISIDGIGLIMICSSTQKNMAEAGSKQEISNQLLDQRVELVSRQLVRDLRRRASIDMRG
jgi:peptidyl-prolyl cis-trans isomerase SurA